MKILVVEDDVALAKFLRRAFQDVLDRVLKETAASPASAKTLARQDVLKLAEHR